MPYTATITILDPFMYDEDIIEESRTGVVAAMDENISVSDGNEKPSPFVFINCGSGTSVTSISVSINDEPITATVSLTDGDELLINHKNKEVMKN
jgi:hypothetical protein